MIRHIVGWKFRESAGGSTKRDNILQARQMLESMRGVIPEIRSLEVTLGLPTEPDAQELILVTEFASMEDLELYKRHPAHLAVADFMGKVRQSRVVADYAIPEMTR